MCISNPHEAIFNQKDDCIELMFVTFVILALHLRTHLTDDPETCGFGCVQGADSCFPVQNQDQPIRQLHHVTCLPKLEWPTNALIQPAPSNRKCSYLQQTNPHTVNDGTTTRHRILIRMFYYKVILWNIINSCLTSNVQQSFFCGLWDRRINWDVETTNLSLGLLELLAYAAIGLDCRGTPMMHWVPLSSSLSLSIHPSISINIHVLLMHQ